MTGIRPITRQKKIEFWKRSFFCDQERILKNKIIPLETDLTVKISKNYPKMPFWCNYERRNTEQSNNITNLLCIALLGFSNLRLFQFIFIGGKIGIHDERRHWDCSERVSEHGVLLNSAARNEFDYHVRMVHHLFHYYFFNLLKMQICNSVPFLVWDGKLIPTKKSKSHLWSHLSTQVVINFLNR